jgi:Zn-dependent protease
MEPQPHGRPQLSDEDAELAAREDVDRWGRPVDAPDGTPGWEGTWPSQPPEPAWRTFLRRLWAPIVALGLLLWKLKAAALLVFKLKIFTTAGTMLVSVGAYALLWGWWFAVGFVLLLFVHEAGHALEAKRQGLDVSAPLFIPFLGAVIAMRQMPQDVWREAQVAIAGPILGSIGAAACWGLGKYLDSDLLVALGFTGFLLNLFNLAPFGPLDGGRIAAAVHPGLWIAGLAVLVGLLIVAPNPILILILVLGGMDALNRWRTRGENAEYFSIAPWKRFAAASAYIVLAAALALAMSATHLERDL